MSAGSITPPPPGAHSASPETPLVKDAQGPSRSAPKLQQGSSQYVVLTGNPNCGKTTIFNALTGLRARVGNYAGVTVERKEGKLLGTPPGMKAAVLDLPGTYSLSPQSLDEQVSRDVLLNRLPEVPSPALVIVVVDASNLQRNLYYATQVIELGHPTVLALNMMDVATQQGQQIDTMVLARELGVPVVQVVGSTGKGIPELKQTVVAMLREGKDAQARFFAELPLPVLEAVESLTRLFEQESPQKARQARAEALLLLGAESTVASNDIGAEPRARTLLQAAEVARETLDSRCPDWRSAIIEGRYRTVAGIQKAATTETGTPGENFSDRLDRVLTHRIWGTAIFLGVMALMFQSIFTIAKWPMDALEAAVNWLGGVVNATLPAGDLNSLLVDGVIAGVGAVVVFLPQILLLFLFIGFLEDTGYMARAAFIMDRVMSKVGLHGKSFIPMVSSFACAIPGIMATRTIENPRDRLVTILIAPLMSCSARLPVYTLLIAACIPETRVLGIFKLTGLTMLAMYLLGVVTALAMAWIFKNTLLRGEPPLLILELPPYKRPAASLVLRHMWDRALIFLKQAGTVILSINIVLWFLATYPKSAQMSQDFVSRKAAATVAAQQKPAGSQAQVAASMELKSLRAEESGAQLRNSFAGRLGRAIEPAIAPLGFDWKIGIGLVTSFAAREVFVSTMSTIYNVGNADDAADAGLAKTLKEQQRPDGKPVYTPLTGLTLMVFYVYALQCVSTVAVVRRETNSWKWPIFQWLYLGALAWLGAFVTWRIGLLLGFQ